MAFIEQIRAAGPLPQVATLTPPMFYWLHGAKTRKTEEPGVFYIKDTEVGAPPTDPWQPDDRFFKDSGERGYSAEVLLISFIARRAQWYIPNAQNRNAPPTWLENYEPGSTCRVEWICFVQGIDVPCLYRAEKVSKSKPIDDAIKQYRMGMLRQASTLYGHQLPLWAFWLPFANERTKDGAINFQRFATPEGGEGAAVTLPVLTLPDMRGAQLLDALYVGNEVLKEGFETFQQFQGWMYERWRNRDDRVVEGAVVSRGTIIDKAKTLLPPGDHPAMIAPPFEEEDLPF